MQIASVTDLPGVEVPELANVADGEVDYTPPIHTGDADSQQGCSMTGTRTRKYCDHTILFQNQTVSVIST